jgi:2-haloacid dehalogenase
MMKYDLLIFDLDGTLLDFAKAEKRAFYLTLKENGVEKDLANLHNIYQRINHKYWISFEKGEISAQKLRSARFADFFAATDLPLVAEQVSGQYLGFLAEGSYLLPGAEKLIRAIKGKADMVLATNGLADVQYPRIAKSGLSDCFSDIFISEELGFPKPDIRYFEAMFEKLPYFENGLIIGDNMASDILGGSNAGIDSCWFNPHKKEKTLPISPTYEISELSQLWDIFDE